MHSIAAIDVADVLRPKNLGQPVNVHVVQLPREPIPDYAAMQETIKGKDAIASRPDEDVAHVERRKVPTD